MLDGKFFEVYVVVLDVVVIDVIWLMVEKGIGVVLVMDGSWLVGILFECDYVCKIVLCDCFLCDMVVVEIMML